MFKLTTDNMDLQNPVCSEDGMISSHKKKLKKSKHKHRDRSDKPDKLAVPSETTEFVTQSHEHMTLGSGIDVEWPPSQLNVKKKKHKVHNASSLLNEHFEPLINHQNTSAVLQKMEESQTCEEEDMIGSLEPIDSLSHHKKKHKKRKNRDLDMQSTVEETPEVQSETEFPKRKKKKKGECDVDEAVDNSSPVSGVISSDMGNELASGNDYFETGIIRKPKKKKKSNNCNIEGLSHDEIAYSSNCYPTEVEVKFAECSKEKKNRKKKKQGGVESECDYDASISPTDGNCAVLSENFKESDNTGTVENNEVSLENMCSASTEEIHPKKKKKRKEKNKYLATKSSADFIPSSNDHNADDEVCIKDTDNYAFDLTLKKKHKMKAEFPEQQIHFVNDIELEESEYHIHSKKRKKKKKRLQQHDTYEASLNCENQNDEVNVIKNKSINRDNKCNVQEVDENETCLDVLQLDANNDMNSGFSGNNESTSYHNSLSRRKGRNREHCHDATNGLSDAESHEKWNESVPFGGDGKNLGNNHAADEEEPEVMVESIKKKHKKRKKGKSDKHSDQDKIAVDLDMFDSPIKMKELSEGKKNIVSDSDNMTSNFPVDRVVENVIDICNIENIQVSAEDERKVQKVRNDDDNVNVISDVASVSAKMHKTQKKEKTENVTSNEVNMMLRKVLDRMRSEEFVDLSLDGPADELDTEDVPVEFEVPPLHRGESIKALSKEKTTEFLNEGFKIRQGRWTIKERKILLQNWIDFSERFKVYDSASLLGINMLRKKKVKLLEFIKAKHFYLRLAKGLNDRTLYSVYRQARNLLDPNRNSGKLTAVEVANLKKYQGLYGNNWTEISNVLGKTAATCRSAYRSHQDNQNTGSWSKEEEENLKNAVHAVVGKNVKDLSYRNCAASWNEISKLVGTRNAFRCREHWLDVMCSRKDGKREIPKWGKEGKAVLIYMLYKNLVEDEASIDWVSLFPSFKSYLPSTNTLKKKWRKLKYRVPLYKKKSHKEIVTYLFTNKLPKLMSDLNISMDDLMRVSCGEDVMISDSSD